MSFKNPNFVSENDKMEENKMDIDMEINHNNVNKEALNESNINKDKEIGKNKSKVKKTNPRKLKENENIIINDVNNEIKSKKKKGKKKIIILLKEII